MIKLNDAHKAALKSKIRIIKNTVIPDIKDLAKHTLKIVYITIVVLGVLKLAQII